MLTDTHCHLDFNKFDEDRDAVIQRSMETGIERILIPGLDLESSQAAIKLAESHPTIYAAVGFHPTDLDKFSENAFDEIKKLASHAKVVAVGEIGIDYYWVKKPDERAFQIEILRRQLAFAASVNNPVIIHMREEEDAWFGQASIDLLQNLREWHKTLIVENHPLAEKPGVLHSFNGNLETAQKAIELNFYIGVTGPVTYKNADHIFYIGAGSTSIRGTADSGTGWRGSSSRFTLGIGTHFICWRETHPAHPGSARRKYA